MGQTNQCKQWVLRSTYLLIAVLHSLCATADAQGTGVTGIDASQESSANEQAATKLSAADIYKELERLLTIQSIKMQQPNARGWAMDADSRKAVSFAMVLDQRHKAGEPDAAFYYALYNSRICSRFQSIDSSISAQMAKDCWKTTLEGFKVASNAQMPAATANVAKIYQQGLGVTPSKLVAAEWFLKAAEQYTKAGSRDEALTSLESALTLAPDHPAALRLKQAMLK